MKLFGFNVTRDSSPAVRGKKRAAPSVKSGSQRFAAGDLDRLTASFTGSSLSINEECRRSLQRMQYRSRALCMDNDYMRKFLKMVSANVVGPTGINLQCQFQNDRGEPDLADQQFVENHFKKWGARKHCSIDGMLSWKEIQTLAIQTIARDGEVLIQKIRNRKTDYFLKLRVLECDHLDISHNKQLGNGRRIVMGVELDANDRRLAYWLTSRHPGEYGNHAQVKRRRVPARDMLHLFITDRPGQIRGVPWVHSSIRRLNMLGGYEEAELVAARIGASKMGFYTSEDGASHAAVDDMAPDGQDYDDRELVEEVEPGMFRELPEGVGFTPFDPQHPTSAFPDFTKAVLRGASSGLNVAYNTLANDLEGVNFSSIRSGVLEEREQWRSLQNWLADVLHDDIYQEWLALEIDMQGGALNSLPADKISTKFSTIKWQPRGWDWVDPAKDIKAAVDEYNLGSTSLTEIVAKKGKSLDDVFRQRQADDKLAEQYGQTVGQVINQFSQTTEATNDGQTQSDG